MNASTRGFASATAYDAHWQSAARQLLAVLDMPQGANLGFVYYSASYAAEAQRLITFLRHESGIDAWVGAASAGLIGHRQGVVGRAGLSVLVCALPQDSFQVFSGRERLVLAETRDPPYFAVVHADPSTPDMGDLVMDMASKLSTGYFTGGLVMPGLAQPIIANQPLSGGISGVAFTEHVPVATRITQGCRLIPHMRTVTACHSNVIEALDERPALDAFLDAAGTSLGQNLKQAARHVLVALPVPGRDTSDYRVRNIIGVDPDNGLIAINDTLQTGQTLMFCRRDPDSAREDMHRMLADLRDSLESTPRAGLYISCAARGAHAFGGNDAEARLIDEYFPGMPLAGFFANGEIAHDQVYAHSGVLTLFL